jgi:hypothetical protein
VFWESLLHRIPVVKSIYGSVKQVSDSLLSGSGMAFKKVLLVRYPHAGAWSLAFQTNIPDEVVGQLDAEHVAVFIPTTPSPVNGFYFYVRRDAVIELDMSVDAALKAIVSMGVVAPVMKPEQAKLRRRLISFLRILHMRTHYCGAVNADHKDTIVNLCGWASRRRDHGGVIFIDLRDREGTVQVVIDPDTPEAFKVAEDVRSEFVLRVVGKVRARPAGTENPNLPTGMIEVLTQTLEVLNPSA